LLLEAELVRFSEQFIINDPFNLSVETKFLQRGFEIFSLDDEIL